ncbi:MAG: hypothetical protein AB7G34_16095, partial [Hyphomicrobiales bacterium]
VALMEEGKTEEAELALREIADGGPAGYRTLARFRLAAAKIKSGAAGEAVNDYDALAADSSIGDSLQDLARIRAATLRMDEADVDEMKNRLGGLADGASPWRHSARELLGLTAFRAGDMTEAARQFTAAAADAAAPPRLRQRAEMMLALINKPEEGAGAAPKS